MAVQLKDIETTCKQSFVLCRYTAKDGSVIKKKYSYASISEAKKSFKQYIESNGLG